MKECSNPAFLTEVGENVEKEDIPVIGAVLVLARQSMLATWIHNGCFGDKAPGTDLANSRSWAKHTIKTDIQGNLLFNKYHVRTTEAGRKRK